MTKDVFAVGTTRAVCTECGAVRKVGFTFPLSEKSPSIPYCCACGSTEGLGELQFDPVEVPWTIFARLVNRRARMLRVRELEKQGPVPEMIVEKEQELIDSALDELLAFARKKDYVAQYAEDKGD